MILLPPLAKDVLLKISCWGTDLTLVIGFNETFDLFLFLQQWDKINPFRSFWPSNTGTTFPMPEHRMGVPLDEQKFRSKAKLVLQKEFFRKGGNPFPSFLEGPATACSYNSILTNSKIMSILCSGNKKPL